MRAFTRLTAAVPYLRSPRALLAKAVRVLRRARAARDYRRVLAAGELVVVAGPPGGRSMSVVMPVFRVREEHLRAAIASVREQTREDWELIIVDDGSPDPHVARVLDAAASDRRIRVHRRGTTGGISRATDDGVSRAAGEWLAFLDHDDLLHPRALELVDRAIAAEPSADWIFTDEDKVDERGRHHQPCLKPGWSPHLLLSFNLVCHLRVVRRAALERAGGHRSELDGAQDYDLALRVLAAGGRFVHLPGVLYHWRTVRTSMATAAAAKPKAHERALRALVEHVAGFPCGGEIRARVLIPTASFFAVRRAADAAMALAVLAAGHSTALGRPAVALGMAADWSDVITTARTSHAPVLMRPASRAPSASEIEELLSLLLVPGTGLVAGRTVRRGRVAASGFVADDGGVATDPWRAQAAGDPGYLNLAAVPAPRLLPPARGWVALREPLIAAWDIAPDVAVPWRIAVGLHRTGLQAITTPTVSWPGEAEAPPAAEAPAELPRQRLDWLRHAGAAAPRDVEI